MDEKRSDKITKIYLWANIIMAFQWSCMDVRVGLWRKLSTEKWMLLNCGVGEDSRVTWTARRSNQSILKEISPGCSLEGLMLKMLGGTGGSSRGDDRGWDGWMASLTRWTWVWVNSGSLWWRPAIHGFSKSQTQLSDWTELNHHGIGRKWTWKLLSCVWLFVTLWTVVHGKKI